MTEQQDPLAKEILNFSWTVDFTNAVLQELGERPHIRVANLVNIIRQQGGPQFEALLAKYEAEKKDEQ
jgi:hypothetical protein